MDPQKYLHNETQEFEMKVEEEVRLHLTRKLLGQHCKDAASTQ
jgi:hypothetical protein